MRGLVVFLGFLTFSGYGLAQGSKPFVMALKTELKSLQDVQVSQSCFLQKHLPQHLEFVVETLLPRVVREAQFFTQKQNFEGQDFYVADELSYRDLYHVHLRYPGVRDIQNIDEFLDSKVYHLQYHSFEHLDLMKFGWLRELEKLPLSAKFQGWVAKHIETSTQTSSGAYTTSGGAAGGEDSPKNIILELSELQNIARIWNEQLGPKSQGEPRLMLRLLMINDIVKNGAAVRELMKFRSIASFDHEYKVITPGLNLTDFWQPLDIFYASVESNLQIAEELRAFSQRTGMAWVGNPLSRDGKYLNLPAILAKDAQETFDRITALAMNDVSSENVFKNTGDQPKFITAYTLRDGFVFALRYNMSTYCK